MMTRNVPSHILLITLLKRSTLSHCSPNFIKTFFNGIYKKSQSRFFRQKNVGGASKKQEAEKNDFWKLIDLLSSVWETVGFNYN